MAFFFATPEDLLPILLGVERRMHIKYTPCGHFGKPDVNSFLSARVLPTLFQPARNESAVNCPSYLVTELDTPVRSRKISRFDGSTVWAIDQLENPDSTVLSHGGLYEKNVLLQGEVRTCNKTSGAARLQRAFDSEIRKFLVKIRTYRVGKQAEALLDAGIRLTQAKQSPPEYDLRR